MTYDNNKISLGADCIAKYKLFGEKVLNESAETLKKAGITVPVGQSKKDADAPIKGFSIEHIDTNNEEPVELPTEEPVELPTETPVKDEKDTKSKEKENSKSDSNSKDEYSISNNNSSITDSKHSVNNTYNTLITQESTLSNKDNLSSSDMSNHDAVSDFIDVMDDIDDAGQRHIGNLTKTYPKSGHLSGGIYTSYEKNSFEKMTIFQGNIENSWQNKSENFVISGSASFGYENTKTRNNPNLDFDIDESDFENAPARAKTLANDENTLENDNSLSDNSEQQSSETVKSGNFSLNLRLDKENYIYGAGINSNFFADGVQIHDQNISIMHKSSGLAGDLTRRTAISKDEDTGETIVRSQNKLKISIVSRNEDSENPFAVNSEDNNVNEENSQDLSVKKKGSEDNTNENENTQNPPEKIIEKDLIKPEVKELESKTEQEAKELKGKVKDGSGLNIDFEYNGSNCGATAQYGIHIIDKPEEQTRLTVAPILGLYDHTPAEEEDTESAKLTFGSVAEFKKYYKNGNKINADLCVAVNRIVAQGYRPSDTKYAVFTGSFVNPKKKFSVGVDAATILTPGISVNYATVNANLKAKHSTWGLQAGVTNYNIKSIDLNDTDLQIALKCTFDLNYKTKK